MSRYVYVLKCHKFYKIGIATDIKKRMSSLQIGNPYQITLVEKYKIPPEKCLYFEQEIHRVLRGCRKHVRGEWFTLGDEVLDVIKNRFKLVENFYNKRTE